MCANEGTHVNESFRAGIAISQSGCPLAKCNAESALTAFKKYNKFAKEQRAKLPTEMAGNEKLAAQHNSKMKFVYPSYDELPAKAEDFIGAALRIERSEVAIDAKSQGRYMGALPLDVATIKKHEYKLVIEGKLNDKYYRVSVSGATHGLPIYSVKREKELVNQVVGKK